MNDGKLGLFECVNILIGGMIGSAIFSLSGLTMYAAGPAAILSWLIAGIVMALYGMLVCELACRYPQSGGVYIFPRKAFGEKKGPLWGWLSCWGTTLTNIVAIAFSAIYVGTYLSVAFPSIGNMQIPLALLSIILVFGANIIDFSTTGKINNVIVGLLILTILTYVISAFCSENFQVGYFTPFFTQGADGETGFITSVPVAIIGYSAINAIAFMVSEIRDPEKTVSKSMMIGISVVAIVYTLVIVSTIGLITADFLLKNPGMRFIPLFAACFNKLQTLPWLSGIVSVSATIALMTTILVCVSMGARNLKSASDDGMLPAFIGKTNRNGVPAFASALICVLAAIIACFPEMTNHIVNFGAVFNVFTIAITIVAYICARRKESEAQKPAFRAPGGNILAVIVFIILLLCNVSSIITGGSPLWIYTLVFFILGLVIYYFYTHKKNIKSC